MPRGGKRVGAGRKSSLGDADAHSLGQECEVMWRAALSAKRQDAVAKAIVNVSKVYAQSREVSPGERPTFHETFAGLDYLEDVENALKEDQNIPADSDAEPSRLLLIPLTKPKGAAARILIEIAARESERRGKLISPHMIQRCWTEYRKFEQSLDEDDV